MPLKLNSTGQALIIFLWLGFSLTALSLLLTLLEVLAPTVYESFELLDGLQALGGGVIYVAAVVLFLVWMYQLHGDFKKVLPHYPITPKDTLVQILVPIVNLWGIWNIFSTLADRFKTEDDELAGWGSDLRFWLPLLYIFMFASHIINRIIIRQLLQRGEEVSPQLILLAVAVDLFLWFIWLAMARLIVRAVAYKATLEARSSAVTAHSAG